MNLEVFVVVFILHLVVGVLLP